MKKMNNHYLFVRFIILKISYFYSFIQFYEWFFGECFLDHNISYKVI